MDSSFTIKPRPAVNPRSHPFRDPVAVRASIETELDPTKAVAATASGGAKQNDNAPYNNAPHDEASAREVVIDPQGQEVLFGAVDVRTEHTDQSPNQALTVLRAYRQRQLPKDDPKPKDDDPHADIEA
jgi:hypothetical protein